MFDIPILCIRFVKKYINFMKKTYSIEDYLNSNVTVIPPIVIALGFVIYGAIDQVPFLWGFGLVILALASGFIYKDFKFKKEMHEK